MTYPEDVVSTIQIFEDSKDSRAKIMNQVTKPNVKTYKSFCESLWESILNAEKEHLDNINNDWVVSFIDDLRFFTVGIVAKKYV